jgi:small subunit ribosomal protein S18
MAFGKGRGRTFLRPAPRCAAPKFDYKDTETLLKYLNPHGQILSRKRTGFDSQGQVNLKRTVKRARHLGLLPFVG